MKLRVNEAIARSEANGKKVLKKDIAARLFEGASESAQQVNMTNLCNGTTKRIQYLPVTRDVEYRIRIELVGKRRDRSGKTRPNHQEYL